MSLKNPYINSIGIQNSNPSEIFVKDTNSIYTAQFKEYLYNLQNTLTPTVREFPAGIEPIKVNLQTRQIDIENSIYNDFLSMREDHRADTVYFEMDRYFEDVDLMGCTCIIEYINISSDKNQKANARIYPVTLRGLHTVLDEEHGGYPVEKMLIAWNIGNEATLYDGILRFSITFYRVYCDFTKDLNSINRFNVIYALHTDYAEGNILSGMTYTPEQKVEQENYYSLSQEHYTALLGIINEKNVYWNDL